MPNFMVEMCGSCLKKDVPLFDYMDKKEQNYKHIKNSSIIRDLFPEDFNEEFHNWKLCYDCSILLKGAVYLKKGLLSSQLIYRNYLRIFDRSNSGCNKQFSKLSVQLQNIRVKYETVQEATFDITEDRCEMSQMQLDVENFVVDVLETKDIKIEIDESNYEEMGNNFYCAEPTINMKVKAENETLVVSPMVEMEQHKVFQLSNEGSSEVLPCLNVETEKDAVADCNDDTQTKIANSNCEKITFKCSVCNRKFAKKKFLLKHLRALSDAKHYKCDFCVKVFAHKSRYNEHRRIHTGEKPYKCDLCGNAFSRKSSYNDHRRIHTGEKPYRCDLCGTAFTQKSHYVTHRRIHMDERPYECDLCAMTFRQKSAWYEHRKIHTAEKPYKCDLCGNAFSRKSSYNDHRRIHTGEKPYKCDLCATAFAQKSNYDRHRRIHMGKKPYKCDLCAAEFARRSNYNRHRRIHIGE